MALFRNLERRHVVAEAGRTTIAMEPEFWQVADQQAKAEGKGWQEWTQAQLIAKPAGYGRASWLRVAILQSQGG